MSRLTIDVTDQQHQSLKALAALQGKTIKQYALEKLFPAPADSDDGALEDLKALLNQRIVEAQRGELDTRSMMEIMDSALGASTSHG